MGGGFGDAAVAEGLSEALLMCCPGPNVAPASQGRDLQKHCVLIATSNPCRIARSVPSPPVSNFLQSQVNNGDLQGEQWWLADADTVAQAYPPCSVSLSVLAPRQLPLLRNIFSQARRGGRAAEPAAEPPKQYAQHLVLLSEGFLEAKMALHRSSVVGTNNMPTGLAAKVEHQPVAVVTSTASGQISGAGPRPSSAVPPGIGVLTGRPGPNMPIQPVTVKMEAGTTGNLSSLLHNNNTNNTLPLPMQQLPSSGPVSSQDGLQSSFTSVTGPDPAQDFKSLGNIPSSQPLRSVGATALSGNGMMVHSPSHSQSQSRHTIGSPSLPPSSPLSGIQSSGGGGVPVPTIMPTVTGGTGSLSGTLGVNGQPGGVGMNPSTVGLVGGQGPGGIGAVHSGYNTSAATTLGGNNTMMGGSTQPLSTVNMGVGSPGQGPLAGLGGQGGLNSSNQMVQNALGLPGQTVMGSVGNTIGSSGTGPMMPTTGIPQSPGQGQAHAVNNAVVPAPLHAAATAGTPPQQSSTNSLKYTRLWDGILAGQRKGNAVPIPICKLEGYRQTSSPDTLAGDWPQTMQIMRLIPQEYMNQKDYQRKAELLVFRPLTPHDFLTQLAVKKLCAVIQLPTQTLLLASTDKPGRMIGMLFPGDMVQIKPQVSQQQAASAAMVPQGLAPNSFSQNQLQSQLQSQLPNSQLLQSQLPNQQLSSQQLSNQQLSNQQLSNQQLPNQQPRSQLLSGPASLHGVGFLP